MLLEKAKLLPALPGCYLMQDERHQIIYIGKAKNLRNRVSSYFKGPHADLKTSYLVQRIKSFDFILTQNEAEALVLENTLIKKHLPKYNIRLKDDKSYPYVVIDQSHPFPQLQYARRPKVKEGRLILGPYTLGDRLGEVIPLLNRILKLRQCSDSEFSKRKTPCLLYQINQCTAPCVNLITPSDYAQDLDAAKKILLRQNPHIIQDLQIKMQQHSDDEEFEMAKHLRDSLQLLQEFLGKELQEIGEVPEYPWEADVVDYFSGEKNVDVVIYLLRQGRLVGHRHFNFSKNFLLENDDATIENHVMTFLLNHYLNEKYSSLPTIDLPFSEEQKNLFFHALKSNQPHPLPRELRNKLTPLIKRLAHELQNQRETHHYSSEEGLFAVKELLNLKEVPRIIDALDVAVLAGSSPTGAVVRFHDGIPDKKGYRYFHLEERVEGNNDFAMMEELLERYLRQHHLPDLFLIDGGAPQLRRVQEVLKRRDIDIPVLGIAKERPPLYQERLIIPGRKNPYLLKAHQPISKLLMHLRDEAHRFCRKLHHLEESKRFFS